MKLPVSSRLYVLLLSIYIYIYFATTQQAAVWTHYVLRTVSFKTSKFIKDLWTEGAAVILYGCETWSLTLRKQHRLRVFVNRVPREVLGPGTYEVTGEWRRLHNEELNALYCSPNIICMIKSRRIRWAGHVACMGDRRVHTGFWWGDLRERDHLEGLDINGRIILKWFFKK